MPSLILKHQLLFTLFIFLVLYYIYVIFFYKKSYQEEILEVITEEENEKIKNELISETEEQNINNNNNIFSGTYVTCLIIATSPFLLSIVIKLNLDNSEVQLGFFEVGLFFSFCCTLVLLAEIFWKKLSIQEFVFFLVVCIFTGLWSLSTISSIYIG